MDTCALSAVQIQFLTIQLVRTVCLALQVDWEYGNAVVVEMLMICCYVSRVQS